MNIVFLSSIKYFNKTNTYFNINNNCVTQLYLYIMYFILKLYLIFTDENFNYFKL